MIESEQRRELEPRAPAADGDAFRRRQIRALQIRLLLASRARRLLSTNMLATDDGCTPQHELTRLSRSLAALITRSRPAGAPEVSCSTS